MIINLLSVTTKNAMTYAFLIVVSVAITLKLIFLSFSLYFTMKYNDNPEQKTTNQSKEKGKSLLLSWKQIPRMFLPKSLYCPEVVNKNYVNK